MLLGERGREEAIILPHTLRGRSQGHQCPNSGENSIPGTRTADESTGGCGPLLSMGPSPWVAGTLLGRADPSGLKAEHSAMVHAPGSPIEEGHFCK